MQSIQQRKITFCEEGRPPSSVALEELTYLLNFTYLPNIHFSDPLLENFLLQKGLERLKNQEIDPKHLVNGEKWQKEIEGAFLADVSVRFVSPEVGYGLFAEEDIEKGSYVGEYVGKIRKNNDHLFISNYLYSYPICDEIGRNYVIDAHQGSLMRFANHSYHPNLLPLYAFVEGYYHLFFLALKPIEKGSQLCYNYGKKYWAIRLEPKEL